MGGGGLGCDVVGGGLGGLVGEVGEVGEVAGGGLPFRVGGIVVLESPDPVLLGGACPSSEVPLPPDFPAVVEESA